MNDRTHPNGTARAASNGALQHAEVVEIMRACQRLERFWVKVTACTERFEALARLEFEAMKKEVSPCH